MQTAQVYKKADFTARCKVALEEKLPAEQAACQERVNEHAERVRETTALKSQQVHGFHPKIEGTGPGMRDSACGPGLKLSPIDCEHKAVPPPQQQ